ncbi:MAG: DUF3313 family protein [Lysobacterales bacterium]
MIIRQIVVILTLILSITAFANDANPPEVTVDGLHRVKDTKMALVYAKPDVDLSQYNRIYLTEPQIAFTKNWLQTQNSIPNQTVRREDMERIRTELAALFMEVFRQELQNNGGYVLVDGIADDVLIVHPAIVDLDVFSPDTPGTAGTRSAIPSVGTMTLYMELIDSVTGDMLVKAIDNKYDRTRTHIQAQNRVRNEAAAREMLGDWANLLRLALDEARSVVTQ